MRVIETKVYKFSELSDSAKVKALNWYRNGADLMEFTSYDIWASIQAFGKCFGLKVSEINYMQGYWECDYPELSESENDENENETVGQFLTRKLPSGDCPFTGMCFDEDLLDAIRDNLENESRDNDDLKEVFRDSLHNICKFWNAENDYRHSDEACIEDIEANEYEFTEEGEIV
jgi:hypothetical protein